VRARETQTLPYPNLCTFPFISNAPCTRLPATIRHRLTAALNPAPLAASQTRPSWPATAAAPRQTGATPAAWQNFSSASATAYQPRTSTIGRDFREFLPAYGAATPLARQGSSNEIRLKSRLLRIAFRLQVLNAEDRRSPCLSITMLTCPRRIERRRRACECHAPITSRAQRQQRRATARRQMPCARCRW